ncbi:CHAP domain-containing protein [Novosphingobium sp.]|uniref:CHAP domain-containing protein n=1 Tax=Novosphingobium sp. TaxID=1874826 RepID=UPI00261C309A|nr:CHAP domain-containing protein [Novosphingobium sp.]
MGPAPIRLALLAFLAASPALALARPIAPDPALATGDDAGDRAGEESGLPYIQCVPYARMISGIRLFGDAHTWWDQAAGRYARGTRPKVGAVMAFRPYGAMRLGHVAAVSRIIDSRTVLLRHANWSPIEGRRGRLEDNVRAVDVSPANDWSEVRVWYAPLGGLGTTHWPVEGFIYNQKPAASERLTVLASADAPKVTYTSRIGPDFLKGIVPETSRPPARRPLASRDVPKASTKPREEERTVAVSPSLARDPIGRIIASRVR